MAIQITEQLLRQTYSEYCQTFKLEHFSKKNNAWVQVHNQKFFRGRGDVAKLGHINKNFVKSSKNKGHVLVWLNTYHYAWISLNVLEMLGETILTMLWLWICLIILHVQQAFEDTLGSKCARVQNIAQLYMQGLHRVLNMLNLPHYASIMPEYPSICLTTP